MNITDEHQCPIPDELLSSTKLNITEYGLQVMGIGATDYLPSFSYSDS